jgi:hypothetical protein
MQQKNELIIAGRIISYETLVYISPKISIIAKALDCPLETSLLPGQRKPGVYGD